MVSRCLLSRWRSSSSSSSAAAAVVALTNCTPLCFSYPVGSPHWRPHQSFFSSQAERLKEDEEAGPWLQGAMDVSHPTYMVWGANTGVGKTLVSAGELCEFIYFLVIFVCTFCECLELLCANFVSRFSALCLEEFVHKVCGCYSVSFPCCASSIDQYHVFK
jgi:hypothetical protein